VGAVITMLAVNAPMLWHRAALRKYCGNVLFFTQFDSFRPPHLNQRPDSLDPITPTIPSTHPLSCRQHLQGVTAQGGSEGDAHAIAPFHNAIDMVNSTRLMLLMLVSLIILMSEVSAQWPVPGWALAHEHETAGGADVRCNGAR
jgi:hypothetical protein